MNLLARIKAAFSSEKYQSSSMTILRGQDTKRAAFDSRSAVLAYRSWIFAAANLNAVAVASQPLRLYVKNRSAGTKVWRTRAASRRTKAYLGGSLEQLPSRYAMTKAAEYGDEYEVVEDSHPIITLLSKVNPYQNGFDATVLRILFGELTGNAYVHPVIDPALKIPVELWTMPSQFVEIMPGQKGEEFVKGYRYGATEEQKRENFYAPDEVIHFRRPNPSDLYYGMGKVEAAWGATMANEAIHEMDTAFFANKARPDYLLVVKSNAHPDELERLEVAIDEKLRGSKRTGRFLTTTADIDLKPLSFPPKDLAGREQIVEEIAAVFGVPVSMLKANDPNLASATVGFASWKQTTILPLLRMDEETLNQNLLPLFGIEEDAFLAYDNPVSEDERFAFEKIRSMVAGGIMTANEARMREGLEPIEDEMADALLVNGQPLGGPAPAAPLGMASASPDGLVGPLDVAPDLDDPPQAAEPTQNAALTWEPMPEPERKDALSDCVSEKIPKLLDEGYPQDQAVAIAYSMCREGKSLEEAATSLGIASKAFDAADVKALGDIDTRPPQGVADNARRALEVRARKPESQRGMTAVGIARARDLANRVDLSEDTIRRMLAYFERHEVDKQGSTWDEQGKGWQAWYGWGGDDGWAWAKRKVEEFNRERERNSTRKSKCGCSCRKDSTIAASVEFKDCGTGAGGFKPGNTCGEEDGDSDGGTSPSSKPVRVVKTDAGHEVEVFESLVGSATEVLEDDADIESGIAVQFDEAKEMQTADEISGSGPPEMAMEAYTGDGYGYFTGQEDSPRDEIIKSYGAEYGVIDDDQLEQLVESRYEKRVAEIEQEIEDDPDYFPSEYTDEEKAEAKQEALDEARDEIEMELRGEQDESILDAAEAMKEDLETKTARSRIECCVRLMRGLSLQSSELEQMIQSGYVSHSGVNSWTTDKEVAKSFGGEKTLLVLKNPKVGWVNSADSRSEKEVVRPPSSMKIVKVTRTRYGTMLEVEEDEDY